MHEKKLQLNGCSVLLRPYQINDVGAMYEAVRESVNELSAWLYWCHADYSIEETRTWIESLPERWEKEISYNFAIIDSRANCFLGGCSLASKSKTNRVAELGYWVRTSQTRQGVKPAVS